MRWIVTVLFCLSAALLARGGEMDALAAQMQHMQEQMTAMGQKLESQQKKIEEQDLTIKTLKGANLTARESPAGQALKDIDLQPVRKEEQPDNARLRSWELPPVTVTGLRDQGALREEDRIGNYGQPRWSARRRFAETRAYVLPKGEFEFEYWDITEVPRDGSDTTSEQKFEAEIGMGHRLQLDIYAISHSAGNQKSFGFDEHDVELRYAFADWNKIPGNPTMYAEYKFLNNEPDHLEFKALFSGEVEKKRGLHWAANAVWEHQMGAKQENSYEATAGVSYTVKDELFSVGGEFKYALVDTKDDRFHFKKPEVLIGPSFQISPLKQMHIDFAPLIGLTEEAPTLKSLLIVGWEF